MGVDLQICRADISLAAAMAPKMRESDAAEVWASGGHTPHDALIASVQWSAQAYAAQFNGDLGAIFGVGPASFLSNVGIPWLLGTPVLHQYPSAFHKASRGFLAAWLDEYASLEQMVDSRNEKSLRWLSRLGFTVEAPTLWGYEGRPFHRVHIGRGS